MAIVSTYLVWLPNFTVSLTRSNWSRFKYADRGLEGCRRGGRNEESLISCEARNEQPYDRLQMFILDATIRNFCHIKT